MFQVNNSSHTNYKSINNYTIDLDKNQLANKKSCMGSGLFVVAVTAMVIIIGICLLIYGFNGSFEFNTSLIKNFSANEEINDGINEALNDHEGISANVDVSWSIIGVSSVDMLTNSDIITIRGLHSGLLRKPKNDNKVETLDDYKSNQNLWQVFSYYHSSIRRYYFKNLKDNCYLTDSGGYLRCLNIADSSYWIANTYFPNPTYHGDNGSKKRYYARLENAVTNTCFNIGSTEDYVISTDSNFCGDDQSMLLFEIVKSGSSATIADTSSLGMELIDSSLRIKEDSDTVTEGDKKFLGIGNIDGLNNGDIVAIRGFESGLLTAQDNSNKIRAVDVYEDDVMLWIVGYDSGRDAYYFKNYYDSKCYMSNSKSNELKCSNLKDESYWVNHGNYVHSDDSSDYPRAYTSMKNYKTNKCMKIEGTRDGTIDLRGDHCGGSTKSWVRFEIVSYE